MTLQQRDKAEPQLAASFELAYTYDTIFKKHMELASLSPSKGTSSQGCSGKVANEHACNRKVQIQRSRKKPETGEVCVLYNNGPVAWTHIYPVNAERWGTLGIQVQRIKHDANISGCCSSGLLGGNRNR